MLILGIDDAGRGPLIGPMILAGCLVDSGLEKDFKNMGVKDSKQLTSIKREELAEIIRKKALNYKIEIVEAEEIDEKLTSGVNLNTLEAIKAASIINKINKTVIDKIKVIVDCPSTNISKWRDTLIRYIENTHNLEIVCEHKADVNHVSVSAASVIAKSTREKEVEKIKKKLGVDFGSGYPSDPVTCKFLKDYSKKYKNSGIFRKTWQTWADVHAGKEQKSLDGS